MSKRVAAIERPVFWVYIMMPFVPFLLINLLVKNHYVRRHTQQGLILGLIFWAGLFLSGFSEQVCLGTFATLLVIWVGGATWGRRQVKRGDCWLMRQRGEGDQLPRPWALPPEQRPESLAPDTSTIARDFDNPATAFVRGQALINQGRHEEAVEQFLFAFQMGHSDLRARAIIKLEKLGEVERF